MAKKHPRDMTNEEAIRYLFHPKVIKYVKAVIERVNTKRRRKSIKE